MTFLHALADALRAIEAEALALIDDPHAETTSRLIDLTHHSADRAPQPEEP